MLCRVFQGGFAHARFTLPYDDRDYSEENGGGDRQDAPGDVVATISEGECHVSFGS